MIKAITIRTTRPDIKPATCDGERSLLLFEVGNVPKPGAKNKHRRKDFYLLLFTFIAICDITKMTLITHHSHNKHSS